MNKHMRKWMSVLMAICLFCSFGTLTAFAAETDQAPIVIGEFDGLLSDYWVSVKPPHNLRSNAVA